MGDKELPVVERPAFGGEDGMPTWSIAEAPVSAGTDRDLAGGRSPEVKNPTWRTLGSMTVRVSRRDSMEIGGEFRLSV